MPAASRIASINEITAANIIEPKNVPMGMATALTTPSLLPRLLSPGSRLITTPAIPPTAPPAIARICAIAIAMSEVTDNSPVEKSMSEKIRTSMPVDTHIRAPKTAYENPSFSVVAITQVSGSHRGPVKYQNLYCRQPPRDGARYRRERLRRGWHSQALRTTPRRGAGYRRLSGGFAPEPGDRTSLL